MDKLHPLSTILQFNRATVKTHDELRGMFDGGLMTETEFLRAIIDLANRTNAVPAQALAEFAADAFPYGVAAGTYYDGAEDCKYCDQFATMRDALVAWEEHKGRPWARIEYRMGDFIFGMTPEKVMRSEVVQIDGEDRTVYSRCDADGNLLPNA